MLIDDKVLIKALEQMAADDSHHNDTKSKSQHRSEIRSCIYKIAQQPIAYDVDAVVRQIKEYAECNNECLYRCDVCAYAGIIEIVKNGGV